MAMPIEFNLLVCPRQQRRSGFTVMELLVAVTLLIVVVVAVTNIFSYVVKAQKRIYVNQQLQANLRFATESMVREIHQDLIDYAAYVSPLAQEQTELRLRDANGNSIRFRQSGNDLELSRDVGVTWGKLLSDATRVVALKFYLAPTSDPLAPCPSTPCSVPNEQPRVTIVLTAQSTSPYATVDNAVFFQTTVTTRTYRR